MLQVINENIDGSGLLAGILISVANPALLSLLGARLLFNMKEAGEKGLNQGTSCRKKFTVSGIDFAEPSQVVTGQSQGGAADVEPIEIEEIC